MEIRPFIIFINLGGVLKIFPGVKPPVKISVCLIDQLVLDLFLHLFSDC